MMIVVFFLAGGVGGLLAGLGMGGGTLTVPVLTLGLGVAQLAAQFVNLCAFVPTGAAALAVHLKNGLVQTRSLVGIVLSAVCGALIFSSFASALDSKLLGRFFGGFLVIMAIVCLSLSVWERIKSR